MNVEDRILFSFLDKLWNTFLILYLQKGQTTKGEDCARLLQQMSNAIKENKSHLSKKIVTKRNFGEKIKKHNLLF